MDHGAFVTLKHANAARVVAELDSQNIKVDARGEYLRICPDILNSSEELERAAQRLGEILKAL